MLSWASCTGISGVLSFAWIAIYSEGGFIAFPLLYGFFSGALTIYLRSFSKVEDMDDNYRQRNSTRKALPAELGMLALIINNFQK